MVLQGEARILIDNKGKQEALTLDAANDELAPVLKQTKGSTHAALKIKVRGVSRCDLPTALQRVSVSRRKVYAGYHTAEPGSERKVLHSIQCAGERGS